jgi:signal transduction histidine kinase
MNLIKCASLSLDRAGNDPEKILKNTNIIKKSIDRTNKILDKMLASSKGQSAYKFAPNNISDILSEVHQIIKGTCLNQNITIEVNNNYSPLINCDETSIYQVILNISLNAIQAMEKDGQITYTLAKAQFINLEKQKIEGVVLSIKDTGKGISAENLKKIYQPFFTTKHSAEEIQHVGLGLSIASKIIKDHQGLIDVKSEVNIGTEFLIYLPG